MSCGCTNRCKRWRAKLNQLLTKYPDGRMKGTIRTLRNWLLRCPDEE